MYKNVLVFGLVIGIILCVNMIYMVNQIYTNSGFKGNEILGYAAMVIVFLLIYFGTRNYRNKQLDGYITFAKAFKVGFLIALVASTMYVVVWLFYYYLFVPDFIEHYASHVLNQCSTSDLQTKTAEMENLKELYKNPVLIILITYSEVLPIGIVMALLSSVLLKKSKIAEV